jgi:hypothetical protein
MALFRNLEQGYCYASYRLTTPGEAAQSPFPAALRNLVIRFPAKRRSCSASRPGED